MSVPTFFAKRQRLKEESTVTKQPHHHDNFTFWVQA